MLRLDTTLAVRLTSGISLDPQERWIRQLVSAAAWLETLGYAHGDLRPQNILLDQSSNIVVTDSNATVKRGAEL
jgi:serine/threonine protein kinase